jgi:hypothetical protein
MRGGVFAALIVAAALVIGLAGREPRHLSARPRAVQDDTAARVAALEGLIPDQAHIMTDVGEHFADLWFAGRAANWPLADFHLAETKSHLHWAVRRIPIRKDNQGRDVALAPILEAFENSQLARLKQAIDETDGAAFERVYRESLELCYSCHKAADKPYLRPRVPDAPATPIINVDPAADWPR